MRVLKFLLILLSNISKLEIEESHLLKKYMQPLNFRQQICVSKKEK